MQLTIIAESGHTIPDDYYESFMSAGSMGIISPALSEKLAPSAGLRNRLVHDYDALDHAIVFDAIKMAEEFYPVYIREIEDYIEKPGILRRSPSLYQGEDRWGLQ